MKTKLVIPQIGLVILLVLGAICAGAQTAQPTEKVNQVNPPRDVTTRIYHVKNADPRSLEQALSPAVNSGQVRVASSSVFRTLTLTGQPQALDVIESLLRELDVAPPRERNVEILAYLLVAADAPSGDQKMPAALDPVVKQLRATFQYPSYQLLDTILIRNRSGSRSGQAKSETSVPGVPGQPATFGVTYNGCDINRDDKGTFLRLDNVQVSVTKQRLVEPGQSPSQNTLLSLSTNIDLREGQMTVVGKSSFELGAKAFIVVFNAKVLD